MKFFVPYHIIKMMTLKQGNSFRHNLSWRVYLYLVHCHHGRMKWEDRKLLVKVFNSSHTAIHRALAYLQEEGWISMNERWINSNGENKIREITYPLIGRNFNTEFSFELEDLLNRQRFTNHLFICIFQTSAMIRGKEYELTEIPQTKLNSDSVILKGGSDDNFTSVPSVKNEFIQRQSATYQAKMCERHPHTIVNRNKSIDTENSGKRNKLIQTQFRQALTEAGYLPKEKSQLIASKKKHDVIERLDELKASDPAMKSSFIILSKHGSYLIVKAPATEYSFRVECRFPFKKFNGKFEVPEVVLQKPRRKKPKESVYSIFDEVNAFNQTIDEPIVYDESIPLPF